MAENGDREGGAGGSKAALFTVAALILLAGGWAMQREIAAPPSAEGARALASPATDSPPSPPQPLRLIRGEEALIESHAGAIGEPLTLHLALSEDATGIGINSIWLYGENHAPLQISGERTDPGEVRVEIASELLSPGPALSGEMGAEGRPHFLDLDEEGVVTIRRIQFDVGHGDGFRFE